jgi:hypothetical protein
MRGQGMEEAAWESAGPSIGELAAGYAAIGQAELARLMARATFNGAMLDFSRGAGHAYAPNLQEAGPEG